MEIKWATKIFSVCVILATNAFAEVVKFPDEELARETALPVFSSLQTVKNKNISMEKKVEVGGFYGWNFTEPIYNQTKYGALLGYHWSDYSGLVFDYTKWAAGFNSTYSAPLQASSGAQFDRLPKLNSTMNLNYEYRIYYGKISLTKQTVMNLHLYPLLGVSMTTYQHKSFFGVNAGIGWKFFLTKSLAMRTDFLLNYSGAPNVFSPGEKLAQEPNTVTFADFTDKWNLSTQFQLGGSFIF